MTASSNAQPPVQGYKDRSERVNDANTNDAAGGSSAGVPQHAGVDKGPFLGQGVTVSEGALV